MNYSGNFQFSGIRIPDPAGGTDDAALSGGHTIVVPDAHLLFSGDYKRTGVDLVLSKDGHEYVVPDYFKGPARASLTSPDGALLTGSLVTALTGEVQVAQLGGGANTAAQVIGAVTRLTGSATAIRNGVSIQLNMGDKVNKGDVVQAGADSSLGITFIDGTVFGLSANARMVLNEMVYDPNGSNNSSLLSLVQGTITFVAGETAKKGDMRVDTPVATMGIRGTAVLVEIGFEVPGQGGAPPVKFQVLVEPGGVTGSYVLYSRTDPTVIIGTVNTAGQVTSVTGTGDALTAPAPPLSPEALAIIAPIFQLYFPNVPNPNPRGTGPGGGSPPPGTVPGGTDPEPLQFNPFEGLTPEVPTIIPINLPGSPPGTPPVLVTLTRPNTPPTIEAARLAVPQGGIVVLNSANIDVVDPDSSLFTFTVFSVTHGRFETSADGVDWVAATTFTTAQLDTGQVRFVHDGSTAAPTFAIQADDGRVANNRGNLQAGTVEFSVANHAPVVTYASFAVAEGGTVVLSAASIGISDADSSAFTFIVSGVTRGVFQTSADGINWVVATTFTTADLDAGHVRFVHDGSEIAPTFSIQANNGAIDGISIPLPGTVAFTNVNDAPVLAAASINLFEGGIAMLSAASFIVTDTDSSAFNFTVSDVAHGAFQTSTDGVNWSNATSFTTADLNAGRVRFVHDGTEAAPTFSVQADDGSPSNHLSNVLPGNVGFGNLNDAPVLTAASFAIAEGGAAVLSATNFGVSDSDSSTFAFTVSDVTHGRFQTSIDGAHWGNADSFSTAQLGAGHVRFLHDGGENAPAFLIQADDGSMINGLSNVLHGSVSFTNVNDAPVITTASFAIAEGGTAVLSATNIGISDSDSSAFAFTLSGVTHGAFQTSADGVLWSNAIGFTTADLNAGHVRFVHNGSEAAPTFSIQADDGAATNNVGGVLVGSVTFTNVNDAPTVVDATTTATINVPIGGVAGGGLSDGAAEIAGRSGLISGIGTASGYGTLALPAGDDNSSGAIDITSVFGTQGINFFGTNYTSLYINNNGNLTFGSPSGAYTPSSINAGFNIPIIAAFWGDVDTRGTGHVYYTLDAIDGVMTITWDRVGYFSSHSNLTNSFQIVLLNEGGGNFDIQYRYADIQWTTGDASGGSGGVGGTPARAGYSAGDGVNYYELPQSGNQSALLSLPTSTGPTGVAFQVNDGEVGPTTLTATGHIDFADPDLGDSHTASAAASDGTVGTLTLVLLHDTTGTGVGGQFAWTYNADTAVARAALSEAPDGALTETFVVTIDDGHGGLVNRTVSVTLNGTGQGPSTFFSAAAPAETGVTTVSGTSGNDVLTGVAIAENFVFAPGMGRDTIVNFDNVSPTAHDTIELDYFASVPVGASGEFTETEFAAWLQSGALVQNGNDTLIHLGDDTLLLRNVPLASLHASDFIVHAGPLV